MHVSVGPRERPAAREVVGKILLPAAFAVATFLSARLRSLREANEARRAAGLAEHKRLALQAELTECRNALRLRAFSGAASDRAAPE